jgi:uncharacterized protein (DUF433 family)
MSQWTVEELRKTDWFGPLLEQIQTELNRFSADELDARPALEKEREQLQKQIQGWSLSLSNAGLNATVRAVLEGDMEVALRRRQEIEGQLAEIDSVSRRTETVVDPQAVVDRLNRLADVLAKDNPSRANLELSLHIDAICCYHDGRAVVRTCKLGALTGATDLLVSDEKASSQDVPHDGTAFVAKPRRRAVRRVEDAQGDQNALRAAAHLAADVNRFAGLGPEWFWEDTFCIPARKSWAEKHAMDVADRRATGQTMEVLAAHFRKTIPTIRSALRYAAMRDESVKELPKKMPRSRWADENASAVAKLKGEGMTTVETAKHFGKSETTIRAALVHAQKLTDAAPASASPKGDD